MIAPLTRRSALAGGLAALAAPSVALAAEALPAASPATAPGYRGPGLYLGWGLVSIVGEPECREGPLVNDFVPIVTVDEFGIAKRCFVVHDLFEEWGLTLTVPMLPDVVRNLAVFWGVPRAKAVEQHLESRTFV